MKTEKLLEVTKKGTDFGLRIPAGTKSEDLELGLANTLYMLIEREQKINPNYSSERLLNKMRGLIKCIKQGL